MLPATAHYASLTLHSSLLVYVTSIDAPATAADHHPLCPTHRKYVTSLMLL